MCGIFGAIISPDSHIDGSELKKAMEGLFLFSETRGKEASGFAVKSGKHLRIHKMAQSASKLITTDAYNCYVDAALEEYRSHKSAFAMLGHARLATNGIQAIAKNNQPFSRDKVIAIHNGIIVNVEELWKKLPNLKRTSQVDTELIPALMGSKLGQGESVEESVRYVFSECSGAINTAMLFSELDIVLLATNTGSLYTVKSKDKKELFFASERVILNQLCSDHTSISFDRVEHLEAGNAMAVRISDLSASQFDLTSNESKLTISIPQYTVDIVDSQSERFKLRDNIKRCTRCILPETMPYIHFDDEGVCNYCHSFEAITTQPEQNLLDSLSKYQNPSADGDCIVAFSGGRDSSYALHYLCEEMGVKPVAYSYDWGMVTDLARRNQARLTGKLGVEHVIISADIGEKRKNIQRNLNAWLKKPHLGMLPILMAGDKHFFYYANVLQKQMGIQACIWSPNHFERTQFKMGFAGVDTNADKKHTRLSAISLLSRGKLAQFYASQNITNPAYINRSYIDTITAFLSYYIIKKNYLYFYDYVPWKEDVIDDVLINTYDWETAADTPSTWRIGDGTAAFYNLVYYMVAGFTENDTFRSNQIRAGHLTRDEALRLAYRDNQPRWESIIEYLSIVNVDVNHAIKVVMEIPTLYGYPEKLSNH